MTNDNKIFFSLVGISQKETNESMMSKFQMLYSLGFLRSLSSSSFIFSQIAYYVPVVPLKTQTMTLFLFFPFFQQFPSLMACSKTKLILPGFLYYVSLKCSPRVDQDM